MRDDMRFDDMTATVLAHAHVDAAAEVRLWRQLIDLLAQDRVSDADVPETCARLRQIRTSIAAPIRAASAERLAGARLAPAVVRFFAEEPAAISRAVLARVELTQGDWMSLLPDLPSRATRVLAERNDLPPVVALAVARPVEERSEAPVAKSAPEPASGAQISELLARIEAFRLRAHDRLRPGSTSGFAFTAGADGSIQAIEGRERDACPVEPLDRVSMNGCLGVDSTTVAAWAKRGPIDDKRYRVAAGTFAGEWRLTARPAFDPAGCFLGYRGVARRSVAQEIDSDEKAAGFSDIVQQLRQPLDAVATFAGPAPGPTAAADVVRRSLELMAAVDEYDAAAAAMDGMQQDGADPAVVLQRLHAAFLPVAEARGVTLGFRIATGLPAADVGPAAVERMFARLLGSVLGLARTGERVAVRLGRDRGDGTMLALSVARPGRLAGRDEAGLLATLPARDGLPDAPLMTLGFALRLVRNLAEEEGGRLDIGQDRLLLLLPLREPRQSAGRTLASLAPPPLSRRSHGGL